MARVPELVVKVRLEWEGVEITHLCPPGGSATMPCCGRSPFEVSRYDRMTLDHRLATCRMVEEAEKLLAPEGGATEGEG